MKGTTAAVVTASGENFSVAISLNAATATASITTATFVWNDTDEVAKYTNAANAAAITALLGATPNVLGLNITNYSLLDATGKMDVAADLYEARAGLTSKALIQAAVTAAIGIAKGESDARKAALDPKLVYTISGNKALVTNYHVGNLTITIPSKIEGLSVEVPVNAFWYYQSTLSSVTKIVIGNGVKLGTGSFSGGSSTVTDHNSTITNVTIADDVIIEDYSFTMYKSLSSVIIGNNVTVGIYAFAGASALSSVTLGSNVTIEGSAFTVGDTTHDYDPITNAKLIEVYNGTAGTFIRTSTTWIRQ